MYKKFGIKNNNDKTELLYKVIHDGGHFLAKSANDRGLSLKQSKKEYSKELDIVFDSLYMESVKQGLKDKPQYNYILTRFKDIYPSFDGDVNKFIEDKIHNKIVSIHAKKRRFRRKAYMNKWNYFVTITYDSKKHSEKTFKSSLKKCLANFHTRRGWKYMGVFERGFETDRLHFHAIFYIPEYEMVGELKEKRVYSKKKCRIISKFENDFFLSRFGTNDFESISKYELRKGTAINYVLKYISKSDDNIFYSRAVAEHLFMYLDGGEDFAVKMGEFFAKYVMFDSILNDNSIESSGNEDGFETSFNEIDYFDD